MEDLKAAGLLDSGPAISVYTAAAIKDGSPENNEADNSSQLELMGVDDLEIKEENLDTEEAPLELSEEAPAEENKPE